MPHYLLLDGARLETRMGQGMDLNEEYRSLYRGAMNAELEAVGPYLFTFPHNSEFKDWFVEKSLGDHWGILAESEQSFDKIYNHIRRFLTVRTEDNVQLYFRFYDPRVLRIFLPTCDKNQLRELFGPVKRFIAEDDNLEYVLSFRLDEDGILQTERSEANIFFNAICSGSTKSPVISSLAPPPPIPTPTAPPAGQGSLQAPDRKKWYFLDE